MNYLKNYNDYVRYVKKEIELGNRPKDKNDYNKNYKGKRYFEFHHIIPKCIGGDDSINNLVALTAREHFLAHYLLMKIYPDNYKLGIAFSSFCMNKHSSKAVIYFNARLYESVKSSIDFGATSRGMKRSEDFCKHLSESQKGRHLGETWKKHISESHADISGNKNPMYGRSHTEDTKKKISIGRAKLLEENPELYKPQSDYAKEHYVGDGNPRAKSVRCIETGQTFGTTKDAAIWAHGSSVSKCTISACCKGKRNIAFGYHWEYVDN